MPVIEVARGCVLAAVGRVSGRDWRGILSNRKPNVISREILMLIIVMVAGLIYSVVSRRRRERRAREDLKDKHD